MNHIEDMEMVMNNVEWSRTALGMALQAQDGMGDGVIKVETNMKHTLSGKSVVATQCNFCVVIYTKLQGVT